MPEIEIGTFVLSGDGQTHGVITEKVPHYYKGSKYGYVVTWIGGRSWSNDRFEQPCSAEVAEYGIRNFESLLSDK